MCILCAESREMRGEAFRTPVLVATAMIIIEFKGTAIMAEIELTQMTATRFS